MMKYKAIPVGQKAALLITIEKTTLLCFAPNIEADTLLKVCASIGSFERVALCSENAIKRILPQYADNLPDNQRKRFWAVFNGVICQNRTYY